MEISYSVNSTSGPGGSSGVAEFTNKAFEDSENVSGEKPAAPEKIVVASDSKEMHGVSDFQNSSEFIPQGFRKMYLAALVVLQFALCMGVTASYPATATANMIEDKRSSFRPSSDQVTWIGSLVPLGALIGGSAGGYFSGSLGRKGTLMWNSLPYVVGWLMVAYAPGEALIYVGRTLGGFCTGIVSVVTPMYLVEISTPETRGLLGAAFQLFVVIGVLLINCLGSGLTWRGSATAGAVASLLSACLMLPMPESPRWLVMKGWRKEAIRAMTFLQGEAYDSEEQCSVLEREIQQQPKGSVGLAELLAPTVLKPALLSIALMFFQQFSGVNAIIFYTNAIFTSAKVPLDPAMATIIVSVVMVLATLVGSLLMDRAGRKVLLIISGSCMSISLFSFSGYSLSVHRDPTVPDHLGWLPVVSLTFFIAAFSVGFGPAPWLMVAEMVPGRYRSLVGGLATALNWTFAFGVTKSFHFMTDNLEDYGVYAFYGTICAISLVVTIFFLPETKGKEMSEIEEFFKR